MIPIKTNRKAVLRQVKAYVLGGFQYGDECKGSWTDYFAASFGATGIVRYNGGMQAAHTVCVKDGSSITKHTFAHIGSSLLKNSHTYITENMVVSPQNLINEALVLSEETGEKVEDILKRVHIHENCLIRTPYHRSIARILELSSDEDKRRGSVGTGVSQVWKLYLAKGIGITMSQALGKDDSLKEKLLKPIQDEFKKVLDANWDRIESYKTDNPERASLIADEEKNISFLVSNNSIRRQIAKWKEFIENSPDILYSDYDDIRRFGHENTYIKGKPSFHRNESLVYDSNVFIFEGSQGLLIDSKYGIHPNVTGVDTTMLGADRILKRSDDVVKIGIVKPLCTRHGMGMFPTEMTKKELEYISPYEEQQCSYWNGKPRYGWLDLVLLNYAQEINKADYIVLSSLDRLNGISAIPVCFQYKYVGNNFDKNTFDNLFKWNKYLNNIYIEQIKNIDAFSSSPGLLKSYLEDCTPIYVYIDGWDYINKENAKDVTRQLQAFIKKYTGFETVGLSFGPCRQDKIMIKDI